VGRPRKREAIMPRKAISTIDRPLFAVFLLVLGATGIGCMSAAVPAEQEKATTDVTALPQEVRTALDRAARVYAQPLNGARWSEVYVLKASEHPIYQVRGTNDRGNPIEIEVTSAGRVIEVEEHGIPMEDVPAVVRDALNGRVPEFKAKRVEAIYHAKSAPPFGYGLEGTDATGKELELYITADGKTFLN